MHIMYLYIILIYLCIGIPNNAASQSLGELWATYEVALLKPTLLGGLAGDLVYSAHYLLPFATVSAANYFGTTVSLPAQAGSQVLDGLTVNATNNVIQFPMTAMGNWSIWYCVRGTATVVAAQMAFTFGSDITENKYLNNGLSGVSREAAGTDTVTQQYLRLAFRFTATTIAANRIVTFTTGTLPTAITAGDLIIAQENANMII